MTLNPAEVVPMASVEGADTMGAAPETEAAHLLGVFEATRIAHRRQFEEVVTDTSGRDRPSV
jgi:hypothetical protein